jgi:hypothetical protein
MSTIAALAMTRLAFDNISKTRVSKSWQIFNRTNERAASGKELGFVQNLPTK